MDTLKMTDRWLQTLKPAATRQEFADALIPGLRLRIGARTLSWSALVRGPQGRKRIGLGKYPAIGLKEARTLAHEASENVRVENPVNNDAESPKVGSVRDLFSFVIEQMKSEGVASVGEYEGYLIKRSDSALNVIGIDEDGSDRAANEITPDDVTTWLRIFHDAGSQTGHPRAYLSAAFSRGLSADYDPTNPNPDVRFNLKANPVTHVGGKMKGKPRHRTLTIEELSDFWHGFSGRGVSPSMKLVFRLLISMGGVRITEIVYSQKDWFRQRADETWLCLPRTKNDRAHDLPLTKYALAAFQAALQISDPSSLYLFPKHHNPAEPQTLNSISQSTRKWCDRNTIERFQPRDLRRTIKTLLIERNPQLNRDWIDVWHNHGRAADVARKHYDRAEYVSAKQAVAGAIDALVRDIAARRS
jgi:integrase